MVVEHSIRVDLHNYRTLSSSEWVHRVGGCCQAVTVQGYTSIVQARWWVSSGLGAYYQCTVVMWQAPSLVSLLPFNLCQENFDTAP